MENNHKDHQSPIRPLIVGEVLFDNFPDGQRVLGGAPFNVAWNLQGMGFSPKFLSAVGEDNPGREIRSKMKAWGLDTTGLQVSTKYSTGEVQVELNGGQPEYHILDRRAYDDIHFPTGNISFADYLLLYTGSLAFRNDPSRGTIRRLIEESGLPRFVDINIRQPWFNRTWIPILLCGASWIKMNNHELSWIVESECNSGEEILAAVKKLKCSIGNPSCFITCGSKGAYAIDTVNEIMFAGAPKQVPIADTVGAGDAFSAATIFGIGLNSPLDKLLKSAVHFSSLTCTIQGATTIDRSHYNQ